MKTKWGLWLLLPAVLALWTQWTTLQRDPTPPAPIAVILAPEPPPLRVPLATRDKEDVAAVPSPTFETVPAALATILQRLVAHPDPDRQADTVEELVKSLPASDLLPSLNALTRPDLVGSSDELRHLILRRWAAISPSPAAQWAAALTESSLRSESLLQVANVWAESDLAQAVGWFHALPADAAKDAAWLSLAYEAARTEPVAALHLATVLPAGPERDQLLEHAARQWAVTDPHAAVTWTAGLQDRDLRERLVSAIATGCATQFPAEAAALAVTALTMPEHQEPAVVAIVQRWAQTDPASAAAWVTQFPDGPVRDGCVGNLAEIWAVMDPEPGAE